MSLDLTLSVDVHNMNITHNLGDMASQVPVGLLESYDGDVKNLTLYDVMWIPEEQDLYYADDIILYVTVGLKELLDNPDKYKKFNPSSGWGDYNGLVEATTELLFNLKIYPNAKLHADR